ncbi:hypothetical protein CPJCM30710_28930 [Clostridium polyendosporum]|uniref:Calcineurin-like phosphoesterase domain-containing protein n=1 Tax=Clostridium polyendosporum TaxID=69208 RepID=A0A919VHG3_9CLOT|nr:metallophosphoesterase [Clostridium polyendosporum]GIM30227.1 hypothetical protein CPJCM30710_28930 [Clostridium polyendosporum]
MKKIILVLSVIIILAGGFIKAWYINRSIKPVNSIVKTAETHDVDLTFSVLGDVHENINHFQQAINDLYTINPSMDVLVLNGDTVDQGSEKQYDSIKKTLDKNKLLLPKTIIKNIGNHEFFNYDIEVNSPEDVQIFKNRYLQFAGEENVYHDIWVKDYHFISLGSEDGNSETIDSVRAFISKKQQKWLKEKLAEKYEKGKPIFVFLHQHLSNNSGWIGVEQSEQVRKILSKYAEVILFTSHTHRQLDNTSVKLNQPFTMVHTGAIHYTIIPNPDKKGGIIREPYIKGLYVEVKGNKVVIKGRDIKEKSWIFTQEISK